MLVKRFITPFKSLLGTSVLFTNKKNRGLRFCVDYHGLNTITKKSTFIIFSKNIVRLSCRRKMFIKFNIIATYNALSIWAGNK